MRSALVVAVVLAASACGDGGSPRSGAIATYESTGTGGDAALLTGTVAFEDGCLYVEADGKRWLPVFPVDEVEAGENTLTYGAHNYGNGDQVDLRGGALSRDSEVVPDAEMPEE